MNRLTVIDHPVAGQCLAILRDRESNATAFRSALRRLGLLLAAEAVRSVKTEPVRVVTPLGVEASCIRLRDDRLLLVPILRAGLGFVEGFLDLLPAARVAHLGLVRDHHTLEARLYLDAVPATPAAFDALYVLDPMLATGNSSVEALARIVAKGYPAATLTLICAIAVERGIRHVHDQFPDVRIVTAAVDPELNDIAYIVPGLGDAGDRLTGV